MAKYPVPDNVFAHHTIILGKTRSGKSSVARGAVERLLDEGRPVGIIDPKGDWWGLKSSADGSRAGYPVIIFGGAHADVPLNAHSGAHVAELVATGNRPFIIDLGGWMVGERTRFFIDFASAFFRLTRGPRHLVIDEVHNFAPQGKVYDPDSGKMLHWANRLASEGAGKGITLVSASQRAQKVHKDYVTSHETLIAMRVIHPLDRSAVKEWVDGAPDPGLGKEVMGTLASMERGEGWVWCPEVKFGPARIQFPMFKTYDSFAAPTSESVETLKGWASVDLDDVRTKLAAVVEEAKANDPRALKIEIANLKRDLAAAQSGAPAWPDQRGDVAALTAELAESAAALERLTGNAQELQRRQVAALAALTGEPIAIPAVTQPQRRVTPAPAPRQSQPTPVREPRQSEGNGVLSKAQHRILDALAWWAAFGIAQPKREQVAFIAGYSPTSGGLFNLLGGLRTAGMLDYPQGGYVALTEAGRALASIPNVELTQSAFHAQTRAKLSGSQVKVLDPVLAAYPEEIASDEVADAAGYSRTSGGFFNLRGSLRTLGLVDYPSPGSIRACDWLFP